MQGDRAMNTESVIIEIRAAEGGCDAKLLVLNQLGIYAAHAHRSGL
jgi:protein subunit release factor A